jgi:hypothetical protein
MPLRYDSFLNNLAWDTKLRSSMTFEGMKKALTSIERSTIAKIPDFYHATSANNQGNDQSMHHPDGIAMYTKPAVPHRNNTSVRNNTTQYHSNRPHSASVQTAAHWQPQ